MFILLRLIPNPGIQNPNRMTQVIGIDLGGTAIKLGRFSEDGICHQFLTVPTPQPATPEAVLDTMTDAILQLNPVENAVSAIGIGTPHRRRRRPHSQSSN